MGDQQPRIELLGAKFWDSFFLVFILGWHMDDGTRGMAATLRPLV